MFNRSRPIALLAAAMLLPFAFIASTERYRLQEYAAPPANGYKRSRIGSKGVPNPIGSKRYSSRKKRNGNPYLNRRDVLRVAPKPKPRWMR